MEHSQKENKIDGKLNIIRFPLSTTKFYELGKGQDWVLKLLKELNEKADAKSVEEFLEQTSIEVELELIKKFSQPIGEYLLVRGNMSAHYVTQCVRSLQDMPESIEIDIKACFLDISLQDHDTYADQTEVFQDNDMYELYFHEKGFANIEEMIHEQVFLNIEQYPVLDSESPLVWGNEASKTKQ